MKDETMLQRLTELHIKSDIGMYYCGKRINTENHVYGPEIKNHYLFVLVNKGHADMLSHGGMRFGEHDLLVMQPHERIYYKALSSWSISWLGLYGDSVKEYMDLLGVTPDKPVIRISLYNELKAVMDNIYDVSGDNSLSSQFILGGLIFEFFSVLFKNSTVKAKSDIIDAALRIIDYNFCENITVEGLAEHFSVDASYFSRKFVQKTGVSPKTYIINKRIGRAKELLCTTKAGMTEISASVGYEDEFYFCRIFKKYTGISPGTFRKEKIQYISE